MSEPTRSNGCNNSSGSGEDQRSQSPEPLTVHHVTLERNHAERLLEQANCVPAAASLAEGGDAPSPFGGSPSPLDFMSMLREFIDTELQQGLEGDDSVQTLKESNKNLRTLVHMLFEQIEVLVPCLDEVKREAENRTAQMQRRLRASADVTRDTVYRLCEWGEEVQNLVSRKCHAEEDAYDMKCMVDVLQKENNQLRQHSANLYHDIHSLLTIMNEARATGNWVMDCVTFCEISPEEVYGPVCNISAQQADMIIMDTVTDENSDVQVEKPGPKVPQAGISAVCPESHTSYQRSITADEDMLSFCGDSDLPRWCSTPYSYRNLQKMTFIINDAPVEDMKLKNTRCLSQQCGKATRFQSSKGSESLPVLPLAAQECPEMCTGEAFERKGQSLESTLVSWDARANKVRRHHGFSLSEEPATPEHKSIMCENVGTANNTSKLVGIESCTHVTVSTQTGANLAACCAGMHYRLQEVQDGITQTDAAGKTFEVIDTHMDSECEGQDYQRASFPAPVSMIENMSEPTSGIAFLSRSMSEGSASLFSSWRRDVLKKCLLLNALRREPGAPDHHQNALQVGSGTNTECTLVGIDFKRSMPVSVSIQTDPTIVTCCGSAHCHPPELKDVITQTEACDKTFGVIGTQTDVEWENSPLPGNQEGDRELRSLKERLNLAAEEIQSKNMLATQLQTHLDSSLKQMEMSSQALQNLEKKLQLSREECENLKKRLVSTEGKLELAVKATEEEHMANAESKTEMQNLVLTVRHLQAALVNFKKNGIPSSRDASLGMPRVHDV